MIDHLRHSLTQAQRWVATYEGFVDDVVADGYDMCVYEYTNDLSCRLFIYDNRSSVEIREMRQRIEVADQRFRDVLQETKKCIHGDYPKECFWFWSCPANSPELEQDLLEMGAL